MKHIILITVLFITAAMSGGTFAGDKEDIQTAVVKTIDAFNKQDYKTYWSYFVDDNTEFPYVESTLRYNASDWKGFIEGTAALAYVNYHEQDYQFQIYNGDAAVVTGYYTFTWMEKGGQMNYQSGRASMVLVKKDGMWKTVHMHFSKMF